MPSLARRGSPSRSLALCAALCACGASPEAPAPASHRGLTDAPAADADDLVVARVDGHPVWGSCVTAQATRTGGDRAAALRDCVAFELLAWRAAARGYADDPDVQAAVQTAMVDRVVDAYERTSTPAELEPSYSKLLTRARRAFDHPEVRASSYVRVEVAKDASPAAVADARAAAAKVAAGLADERGLTAVDFVTIAAPLGSAAGVTLTHEDVGATLPANLEASYSEALYAIPEVGRTAGPVRTPWGWDVILYAGVIPPEHLSDAEIQARVIAEARRLHFPLWVHAIAKQLGVDPVLAPDVDQLLEEAP